MMNGYKCIYPISGKCKKGNEEKEKTKTNDSTLCLREEAHLLWEGDDEDDGDDEKDEEDRGEWNAEKGLFGFAKGEILKESKEEKAQAAGWEWGRGNTNSLKFSEEDVLISLSPSASSLSLQIQFFFPSLLVGV